MARGGFNNALAGGSIDDFLRQLRGQAGQGPIAGPPRPPGVPQPPGYPTPGGTPWSTPDPGPTNDPRFPGDIGGPIGHGRPDGPTTGGVMTQPQAQGQAFQGRGGSGSPVNVMPYKDAPPPPAPEPQAQPDPEPEKKDPPPGSDDAFNAIPENPTARPPGYNARHHPQNQQQNQNQPPPAGNQNQNQPPPSGQQDPPAVVEQNPPPGATSNWENFYNTNPDMQWMRDKGMDALAAAQWNAANSTNATVKAEAQKFLDSMGGGGQGQPPPGGQQEPPPAAQDQPNPAVSGWENFVQTDPNLEWMRHLSPDRAAAHFLRQANTPPEIRQAAQAYMDAVGRGGETPQTGAGAAQQRQIAQVRGALPGWILERMSAEDALNFAMKNPQSKIAGMLREAGVLQ